MPGHVQVHLALEPVSLLKSIDGLCAEVERRFGDDPMHGHVFVFLNRARTGAKLLYWDHGGFVVVYNLSRPSEFSQMASHVDYQLDQARERDNARSR
jgi:transposase